MTGKKAIVTGAGSGLGKGIAYRLAQAGYDLAISYASSREQALALADSIQRQMGRRCFALPADFDTDTAMEDFFAQAVNCLGGLDLFVNNAAVTDDSAGQLFDITDQQLDRLYRINFRSYVIGMREAGTYMAKRGTPGAIINISSVHARCARPEDAVYGAFKAGIERIIKSFALSFAPFGIRVNNLAPGAFRNRTREEAAARNASLEDYDWRDSFAAANIPLGRLGEPWELAEMILFFASQGASYITGETLTPDGGLIIPSMSEAPRMGPDEKDYGWGYMNRRDWS